MRSEFNQPSSARSIDTLFYTIRRPQYITIKSISTQQIRVQLPTRLYFYFASIPLRNHAARGRSARGECSGLIVQSHMANKRNRHLWVPSASSCTTSTHQRLAGTFVSSHVKATTQVSIVDVVTIATENADGHCHAQARSFIELLATL